jgi:membrane fusion protein (multidrug efflux system)
VRPVRPGDLTEARVEASDVTLTEDRRAELILAVENHPDIPEDAKARLIEQLRQDRVPVQVIDRIEARAGG